MPTAGGHKWVKDVEFVDSNLLIKAAWDNEGLPLLSHALHLNSADATEYSHATLDLGDKLLWHRPGSDCTGRQAANQ